MSSIHPSRERLALYRSRAASPDELIAVDRHIAECDQCYRALAVGDAEPVILAALETPEIDEEHLSYEAMERWVDGTEESIERELVEGHIEGCDRCRNELTDLSQARDAIPATRRVATASERKRAGRWLLATAASVAVGFVVWFLVRTRTVSTAVVPAHVPSHAAEVPREKFNAQVDEVLRTGRMPRPDIVDTLAGEPNTLRGADSGGSTFSLVQPLATLVLDPRPQFRWAAVPGAASYTVTVVDAESGAIAVQGSTGTTQWRPSGLLSAGRTYSWQVTANKSGKHVTAPRPSAPEARFRVAGSEDLREVASWRSALGNSHLALGILFAERGFLDEAERELELATMAGDARSGELLAQVRSWRSGH